MEFSWEITNVMGLIINKKSVRAMSKRSVINAQGCRLIDRDCLSFSPKQVTRPLSLQEHGNDEPQDLKGDLQQLLPQKQSKSPFALLDTSLLDQK